MVDGRSAWDCTIVFGKWHGWIQHDQKEPFQMYYEAQVPTIK